LTLSIEQKKLAEERIKEAGLEGRIRVHLLDYREIPAEFEKAFDAFVSVEMLEVGPAMTITTRRNFSDKPYPLSARRCQALQPLFQTCGFRSQVEECHRCGNFLDIPRVEIL